ncbi:LPXTG-domain-containing protein cell wall anchor domain [Enterococcus caccae]|nr:LPXTG-domain-containing protein cell wall anchor domain [Enterococcus caccae]
MLVCPLAIGAVKALAENMEEVPVTEEVAPAVVEKEHTEDLKLEDTENNDITKEEEPLPEIVPNLAKPEEETDLKEVAEATGQQDPAKDAEIKQLSADIEALLTDLELITRDFEYRERYESLEPVYNNIISSKESYINSSGWDSWYSYAIPELQKNLSDLQALRNEIANDFKTLDEFGLDSSVLKDVLDKAEEVKANKEKYTPESFALFEGESDGTTLEQMLELGNKVFNGTYTIDRYYWAYANYSLVISELNYRFDQLVLATDPEDKVNITINYVNPENGTINTLTQEAIEGKPFTATAPDTFTQSTGPKFYRTSDASQTIASASEGAVITFNYEKIMATMNDVIILGATTANVGETKDYIMESTTYFNYGDPRIDYLNFETNNPIVISDPSAADITAGKIKFLKAGTYQLSGAATSESLTVVVSGETIKPTPPTIKSTEWIVTGETTAKQSESKAYGVDEKITFSDDSVKLNKNITIPKGYNLSSSNASDVITNNNIKFGEEGTREVTFTSKTKAITKIIGLTVTVSKDTTVPNPEKPEAGGNNGSGTNTDNKSGSSSGKNNIGNNSSTNANSKGQKASNAKNNNSSNQESDKNLPQTSEKESYIMFLSGLVTLGGMLVAVFKRKQKEI